MGCSTCSGSIRLDSISFSGSLFKACDCVARRKKTKKKHKLMSEHPFIIPFRSRSGYLEGTKKKKLKKKGCVSWLSEETSLAKKRIRRIQ